MHFVFLKLERSRVRKVEHLINLRHREKFFSFVITIIFTLINNKNRRLSIDSELIRGSPWRY